MGLLRQIKVWSKGLGILSPGLRAFDFTSWTTPAVISVPIIVSGSVLERHGAIIRARLGNRRHSFLRRQN